MSRTAIIICAIVLLAWGTAQPGIEQSKHDIIYYFGYDHSDQGNGTEACVFCHHPTSGGQGYAALWDSSASEDANKLKFEVYTSEEWDSMLICQSCHDGAVSDDILSGNNPGNNHPVGFDYVQLSFSEKRFPYYDYRLGGIKGASTGQVYPLENSKMVCITCHDPHTGESHFVRGGQSSLSNSALCLDCHACITEPCSGRPTGG